MSKMSGAKRLSKTQREVDLDEDFVKVFEQEREAAVRRICLYVPPDGGCVRRDTIEGIVRAAFDGGALAGIQRTITAAGCESPEDRAELFRNVTSHD